MLTRCLGRPQILEFDSTRNGKPPATYHRSVRALCSTLCCHHCWEALVQSVPSVSSHELTSAFRAHNHDETTSYIGLRLSSQQTRHDGHTRYAHCLSLVR